ncbi:MAG: DUF1566 domain-containing protein [Flavobacteriales bacterium]|nr:DUF1566 domain-containing protein [Flavobacteriales bacterium]
MNNSISQSVGINNDGSVPAPGAILDINSNDHGILIPRVQLTGTNDVTTISNLDTSLLIYNKDTANSGINMIFPGFYYWDGDVWIRVFDRKTSVSSNNNPSQYPTCIQTINGEICVDPNYKSFSAPWAPSTGLVLAANSTDGESNTNKIVSFHGAGNYAAYMCDTSTSYGFTDWYLPSVWELGAIYDNAYLFGFQNIDHWSSTEYLSAEAYALYFPVVYKLLDPFYQKNKTTNGAVRCVRKNF